MSQAVRHVLTPAEGARARALVMSPQAREKRKCTWEIRRKLQREDVSRLYLQGITVPAAISDELSKKGIQISDKTVRRYLREVGTV